MFIACAHKSNMEVSGGPYRLDLQDGDTVGYIDVGFICETDPGEITVTVNDFVLTGAADSDLTYYYNIDSIPQPLIAYGLQIETDIGTAEACCTLPGNFHITEPAGDVFIDTSLVIAWDQAAYADRYEIVTEMLYIDTVGNLIFKDTVISASTDHITLGQCWFGDVATEGDMTIMVFAVNGAGTVNDSVSNITGGTGAWSAMHGRHKTVNIHKR
jgi:hypothetical protein